MKFFNKVKGVYGEAIAKEYLKTQKFKIIEQNYKNFCGEVDIIAKDGDTLVFLEVKSRESFLFGRPCEAVDRRKQNKIKKVALSYLKFKKLKNVDVRFDVIEILGDEVNYIKNAF